MNTFKSRLNLVINIYFRTTAQYKPLPANIFPNKLASNLPNNIPRNLPLCSLVSFSTALVTPFTNEPESPGDLTRDYLISSISLFDIISVVVPEP